MTSFFQEETSGNNQTNQPVKLEILFLLPFRGKEVQCRQSELHSLRHPDVKQILSMVFQVIPLEPLIRIFTGVGIQMLLELHNYCMPSSLGTFEIPVLVYMLHEVFSFRTLSRKT